MVLLVAARTLTTIVGSLAILAALFMFEEEEGLWQNRVEVLWITIDDKARMTGNRALALFNQVGQTITNILDRVFGTRLISVRSIGTSTSCSSAMAIMCVYVCEVADSEDINPILIYSLWVTTVSALVPIIFRSRWFIALSYIPLGFTLLYIYSHTNWKNRGPLILFGALMVSFVFDILIVIITRAIVRWTTTRSKLWHIVAAMSVQLTLASLILVVPAGMSVISDPQAHKVSDRSLLANIMLFSSILNVFTALICVAMSLVLAGVLVHRLFWPIVSRVVYPAARYEIIRNRKVLILTGAACLAYGFQVQDGVLKMLLPFIPKP